MSALALALVLFVAGCIMCLFGEWLRRRPDRETRDRIAQRQKERNAIIEGAHGLPTACDRGEPDACWNIRCQLGKRCCGERRYTP